jgi:hypothetical protein
MRQSTATPNLSYKVKANIIDLQNWIEYQSRTLSGFYRLSFYRDRYNFNQLVESDLQADVELYYSYGSRLDDCDLIIKMPYSKVVDILAVIRSNEFDNEAIFKKILLKFQVTK